MVGPVDDFSEEWMTFGSASATEFDGWQLSSHGEFCRAEIIINVKTEDCTKLLFLNPEMRGECAV